jgi:secondary thiamine-phosphate synthase enzyme
MKGSSSIFADQIVSLKKVPVRVYAMPASSMRVSEPFADGNRQPYGHMISSAGACIEVSLGRILLFLGRALPLGLFPLKKMEPFSKVIHWINACPSFVEGKMDRVAMICDGVEVSLRLGPDVKDITGALSALVDRAGLEDGVLHAFVKGSTGSITTIEYEPGVVEDLMQAVDRLAPPGLDYAHERAWHDGNGHSHVQAALLGPSLSVPVRGGRLVLGTWQQVVVLNHDNKSRRRHVEVTLIGTMRRS